MAVKPVTSTTGVRAFASGIAAVAGVTVVTYDGSIQLCTTSHTTTGTFDSMKWQPISLRGFGGYLHSFGHSFVSGNEGSGVASGAGLVDISGQRWSGVLSRKYGLVDRNRGHGGTFSAALSQQMFNADGTPSVSPLLESDPGIVCLEPFENDANQPGAYGGGATQTRWQNFGAAALRAAIYEARTGQRINDDNTGFTYTGTWSSQAMLAEAGANNTQAKATTTLNDKVTYTFYGTEVFVFAVATRNADYAGATSVEIRVDGVLKDTFSTDDLSMTTSHRIMRIGRRITGLSAGSHSLEVKLVSLAAGGTFWFDGLGIPSPTPRPVILVKEPIMSGATTAGTRDGVLNSYYNPLMDTVAAEFTDGLVIASSDPIINTATMRQPDNWHPNALGQAAIAAAIEPALIRAMAATVAGLARGR